jgi:DNA-binding response OmpR family regulator
MIGTGLRVLVVEDDPAIGKMVTLILQADAHRVVAVTSGAEAIEHLRDNHFDVLLSDHRFGAELGTFVRRWWPEVRFVPLTKPFHGVDLRRRVAA